MTAKQPRTSDEYGIQLCGLLEHRDFKVKEVDAVIISSVVPDIMHSLGSAIIKYFGVKPYVPSTLDMGLKINTEHPKEVGPDRIVDAVAAYNKYGGPLIVVDFGTATTYDVGVDLGLFNNRLTLTGDYYIRKTTDMIVAGPTVPDVFGAASPTGNYADMSTYGYEISSLIWQVSLSIIASRLLCLTIIQKSTSSTMQPSR